MLKTHQAINPCAHFRIGAKFEGTLRQHAVRDNGEWRDTVYYSVLATEWSEVRARLEGMMGRVG